MIYLFVMTNFYFGKNRYKIFKDAKKADEEGKKWMEMNPQNWFEIHAFNQEA